MRELNGPDSQLEFIIKDCSEAISANPLGHKSEHYLKLARACQNELIRRQGVRIDRSVLTQNTDILRWRQEKPDMIKFALKQGFKTARLIDINQSRWSALNLGLRKLHLTGANGTFKSYQEAKDYLDIALQETPGALSGKVFRVIETSRTIQKYEV